MEPKKEFWIAFLINFFFPGGGHIYAGKTEKGAWLLVISFICAILTPLVYITIVASIVIWIYTLVTSQSVVDEYNKGIIEIEKKSVEEEKTHIHIQEFIEGLNNTNQLFSSEIISEQEFNSRKNSIISQLSYKKLVEDPDKLLLSLVPLKQSGVLSEEEIKEIKKYILTFNV